MTGLILQPRCFHEHLAFVKKVTIVLISFVPYMWLAGFSANRNVRSGSFIMCAALVLALLGHTTLRMCHCYSVLSFQRSAVSYQFIVKC